MKKFLFALVAVLALTLAGTAPADPPAAAVPEAPEGGTQAPEQPEKTPVEPPEVALEDLSHDPVPVFEEPPVCRSGCRTQCREIWGQCMYDCGQLPPEQQWDCERGCDADLQTCLDFCWGWRCD